VATLQLPLPLPIILGFGTDVLVLWNRDFCHPRD